MSEEEMEQARLRLKGRALGNIAFIGHLFRVDLLPERLVKMCITKLLNVQELDRPDGMGKMWEREYGGDLPDEEEVECLVKLLATVGAIFDAGVNGIMIDTVMDQLQVDTVGTCACTSRSIRAQLL
jgi:hypothetical protein